MELSSNIALQLKTELHCCTETAIKVKAYLDPLGHDAFVCQVGSQGR